MTKPSATARNLDDVAAFTVSGASGDVIFREGDTSAEMYVILDGSIDIEHAVGSETRKVGRLEPGDFFGETSLLADGPREVTAKAATDYRILKLDRETVGQLVREEPEIAMRFLRRLSERLRDRLEADARAAAIVMEPLKRAAGPRTDTIARPAAPPSGPAVLRHESGREFSLAEGSEWIVGRIDRASGARPPVDLTDLDTDRMLSRQHAVLVRRELQYYVREDKASRNGTFVNGIRLTPGQEEPLVDGDEVRFASVALQFRHR